MCGSCGNGRAGLEQRARGAGRRATPRSARGRAGVARHRRALRQRDGHPGRGRRRDARRDPERARAPADVETQAVPRWPTCAGCSALSRGRDRHRLAPQPGIATCELLLERTRDGRAAGRARGRGQPRRCRRASSSRAYRIVQEALTNALKHAGAAHARVASLRTPERSSSRSSTTAAARRRGADGGHGLIGMRERVAALRRRARAPAAPAAASASAPGSRSRRGA